MTRNKTTRRSEPKTWKQIQEERANRIAATEQAVLAAIQKMGFKLNTKYAHRDCCYDFGTVRVAFYSDDERCEVYAFDGVIGHAPLKYEVNLPFAAGPVVAATIKAVVETEMR